MSLFLETDVLFFRQLPQPLALQNQAHILIKVNEHKEI